VFEESDYDYFLRSGSGPINAFNHFCKKTQSTYVNSIETPTFQPISGTIYSSDNVFTNFISATVTFRFASQDDFVLNELYASPPVPPTPLVPSSQPGLHNVEA
jgi:hypothetical protein